MNADLTKPDTCSMVTDGAQNSYEGGSRPVSHAAIFMPEKYPGCPDKTGVRGNKPRLRSNNSACPSQVLSPRRQDGLKSHSDDGNAVEGGFSMTATGLSALTLADLNTSISTDIPRISHTRIAERLNTRQQETARLVARNLPELETYGEVCVTVTQTGAKGGRPAKRYWLNEAQALLICMFSRTANAAAVRAEVIRVYLAWRTQAQSAGIAPVLSLPGMAAGRGDGRYLVVVRGGGVADVRTLARHNLVDGYDRENLSTFLRECIPPEMIEMALHILLRRVCRAAGMVPAGVQSLRNGGAA